MRHFVVTSLFASTTMLFAADPPDLLVAIRNGDHSQVRKLIEAGAEGCAVVAAESTRRRFVVRTNTGRAGSAAYVRELPQRLASIRLGCGFVLGNDGLTLYAAG